MTVNRLIFGDNLEILKNMEKDSVDLIYLDPPFFSNRNYEAIWDDTGEIRSFQDRWATFGSVGQHKPLHRMAKRKGRGNAPCTKAHRKHFSTLRLARKHHNKLQIFFVSTHRIFAVAFFSLKEKMHS